jgi:hypothetical protein
MLDLVETLNPPGGGDPHVRAWRAQKLKWVPGWVSGLSLEPRSLNLVLTDREDYWAKAADQLTAL